MTSTFWKEETYWLHFRECIIRMQPYFEYLTSINKPNSYEKVCVHPKQANNIENSQTIKNHNSNNIDWEHDHELSKEQNPSKESNPSDQKTEVSAIVSGQASLISSLSPSIQTESDDENENENENESGYPSSYSIISSSSSLFLNDKDDFDVSQTTGEKRNSSLHAFESTNMDIDSDIRCVLEQQVTHLTNQLALAQSQRDEMEIKIFQMNQKHS